MIRALVGRNDGLAAGRVWLRSIVKSVQLGLRQAGLALTVDGRFGAETEAALGAFQHANGFQSSGFADKSTWGGLGPHIDEATSERIALLAEHLPGFRGDLDWIHEQEGHVGRPYWPGGSSGITLDPGVDLGHASAELALSVYEGLVGESQLQALREVIGLKGDDAEEALNYDMVLRSIRISKAQAEGLMPIAAAGYWKGIQERFRPLSQESTLPSVQTVLLSLAYNRGPQNRYLAPLEPLLHTGGWHAVARRVGRMQQRHRLHGIRVRRRQEAALIRAELAFLES